MTERLVRRLPSTFKRNIGVSHEMLRWVKSGCQLFPFAPGGDAEDMHGETPALVSCDEIWVFSRDEWSALQQSYLPGMITKNAQEWLTSTQGTDDSEALNDLIEAGRALVAEQIADPSKRRGLCYIEYSIPPEVDGVPVEKLPDEALLDLICAHNPAIGYTQTREALAEHLETFTRNGDRNGFIRGYGNHRLGSHRPRVIPAGQWLAARSDLAVPDPVGIGLAVDKSSENVSVVAAGRTATGQAVVEVVQQGTGWWLQLDGEQVSPAAFVAAVQAKTGQVVGVCVPTVTAANRDLADHLEAAGVDVLRAGPADHAAAVARFRAGIKDLTVVHRGQPSLDDAMRWAETGKLAGGECWVSPGPGKPVTAADAASAAVWAVDHGELLGEFRIY
jgi:hypothetical protein